jgi:hypothetical protein
MTPHSIRIRKSLFPRLGNVFLGVVAPQSGKLPSTFANVCPDAELHAALIDEVQRFRGRIYLADGAIPAAALDEQGRHRTPVDRESWHVILLDESAGLCGCMRAIPHPGKGQRSELYMREAIARLGEGAGRYAGALKAFLANAHGVCRGVLEGGGWAVAEGSRNSTCVPILALASWSLAQVLGGCMGLSLAARRNQSAAILRRLGGFPLGDEQGPLPGFYDAYHRGELELLGFDCYHPAPEYEPTVLEVREFLRSALVVVPSGTPVVYSARDAEGAVSLEAALVG